MAFPKAVLMGTNGAGAICWQKMGSLPPLKRHLEARASGTQKHFRCLLRVTDLASRSHKEVAVAGVPDKA